jgi:hypothetical protein
VVTGDLATLPELTAAECDLVYAVAAGLDQMPEPESAPSPPTVNGSDDQRPGDQFNDRASWIDVLGPHGWQVFKRGPGQLTYWQRPGKTHPGVSASTGLNDHDRLYVFSTATQFEPQRPYDKFGAYAVLDHGGDLRAAARALKSEGYGSGQPGQLLPRLVIPTPVPGESTNPEGQLDLWDIHSVFGTIRDFAHSRATSAWAVLGVCLVRVLAQTPPWVVLPPIIGGPASLNLLVGLVGPSGVGKSSAMAVADEALIIDDQRFLVRPLGSGEGISRSYRQWRPGSKGEPGYYEVITDAVIFRASEVDVLTSLMDRAGATLGSQLKVAFDGDQLGFANATAERRVWLEPHSYRFCLVVGVQPEKALALFADSAGGTPQRLLWLDALDRGIPDQLEAPEPVRLVDQEWVRLGSRVVLSVPADVVSLIKSSHLARVRGDLAGVDGHDLLVQLKVAQGLAFLVGQRVMTLEHWAWADQVMAHSRQTRDGIQQALESARKGREDTRARADARRALVVQEGLEARSVARVVRVIKTYLGRNGGEASRSEVTRALAGRDREHLDDALEAMITAGVITVSMADPPKPGRVKKVQLIRLCH